MVRQVPRPPPRRGQATSGHDEGPAKDEKLSFLTEREKPANFCPQYCPSCELVIERGYEPCASESSYANFIRHTITLQPEWTLQRNSLNWRSGFCNSTHPRTMRLLISTVSRELSALFSRRRGGLVISLCKGRSQCHRSGKRQKKCSIGAW